MRLSYRPASVCSLAGRYDNPMPESTISPQSGTKNLATGFFLILISNRYLQKTRFFCHPVELGLRVLQQPVHANNKLAATLRLRREVSECRLFYLDGLSASSSLPSLRTMTLFRQKNRGRSIIIKNF
jgi:hypothetical protein